MTWLEAVVLGIIQGLTEFLPVSSSGHLEIVEYLFGQSICAESSLLMSVVLHAATAIATIVVFRKDLHDLLHDQSGRWNLTYIAWITFSMIPAVVIGLCWENEIEMLFDNNLNLIAAMLCVTAILLLITEFVPKRVGRLNGFKAFIIGVAQAVAILPGMSRSGATICTAILCGVGREEAARFSFIMIIPLIFGKVAKEIIDGDLTGQVVQYDALIIGFLAALFVGIAACKFMIRIVREAKLWYFSFYCLFIALLLWLS